MDAQVNPYKIFMKSVFWILCLIILCVILYIALTTIYESHYQNIGWYTKDYTLWIIGVCALVFIGGIFINPYRRQMKKYFEENWRTHPNQLPDIFGKQPNHTSQTIQDALKKQKTPVIERRNNSV